MHQDKLRTYLKELPREEPSDNFTSMVMDRVRMEAAKPTADYQPLINRQTWRILFIGIISIFIGAAIYRSYFPGNENPGLFKPLYQFDYSLFLKPFQLFSESIVRTPVAFVAGLAAVMALILIDHLYSRFASR